MKRYLLLIVAVATLVGCKREDKDPDPTSTLKGNKYRREAWYNNDGYGQIYRVLEFSENTILVSNQLSNGNHVNTEYDYTATYEILSDILIEIKTPNSMLSDESTSEAIVAADVVTVKGGSAKGVYVKF